MVKEEVKKGVILSSVEEGVKECIQSVDGEVYKTPINFPMNLASSEETGYRHHHYKLSDKISELCVRITELENTVKVLRSIRADWEFNFHKRMVKELTKQEESVKNETRKLKKLKKDYHFLGGIK